MKTLKVKESKGIILCFLLNAKANCINASGNEINRLREQDCFIYCRFSVAFLLGRFQNITFSV